MKMLEVGTFEAKNRLSELLVKASRGQRILITRRGQGVAVLSSTDAVGEEHGTGASPNLMIRLHKFRQQVRKSPESIKSLIEEGRR